MKSYDELKSLIEKRGVHAEFGNAGEGWAIEQNPHELATFLVRMQELGVTSCLEIGTGYKGGLSRFLAADMGWQVTSVDINAYHHVFPGVHYVVSDKRVQFNEPFDLVLIDGDHGYDSVKADYEHYGLFATKVIAFHDIAGLRDCKGVLQFWNEKAYNGEGIKHGFNKVIADSRQCSGIGWVDLIVFWHRKNAEDELRDFVHNTDLYEHVAKMSKGIPWDKLKL